MRKAIYDCLQTNCRKVKAWYQPYVATPATKKPFGVVVFAARTPATRVGTFQDFTVWLYFEPGDYIPLDEAVQEVKQLLHERRLMADDGRLFEIQWTMDGRDFYDDALKAIAKNIEFTIPGGVT